ncbi:MAG: S9 family peptidase [Acidobacteriia bacterium]|nr:S9 family peptidase [Terriglobia bacterium]
MRRFLLFLFTLLYVVPAFAQAKHPFTFEDMMSLKRVAEPVPSPDGKWVLFAAVDVDLAANTKTPHIWMVPTAGGQEREIIADQDAYRPRWSPDGKLFAFLSNKDGGSQVWVAEFDGKSGSVMAARQWTRIPTEASGEIWSPDGKNILFTSDVYPECEGAPAAEESCNAKKLQDHKQSKVQALVFDHLLYRHWNAYKNGKRTHIFITEAPESYVSREAQTTYRDLTPGDYDAPPFSLGGQDNYAFSPDGQEICYTSNHDKVEATSTNNNLWIVPVHVGADASSAQVLAQTRNITADNPASDSTPLYSPDGKYIAYRAQQRPGYESDRFRLMLYDRKTGENKSLTEFFDRWVGTFTWAPDSKSTYFTAEEFSNRVFVESPNVIWQILRGHDDDLSITSDGKTLLFTRMSLKAPNEIYWVDITHGKVAESLYSMQMYPHTPNAQVVLDTRTAAQLTHLNDPVLSQISMSPLESFWFPGAHGDKVQGFLVKPPNFDPSKKYPVKFLIHGGPQGAWGDDWSYRWNPELFAANGYVVVMINFHGSTGYGQKFIDAINGDWGGAPYEDLMKGLDYAEKTYPFIDKARECALGASYGGYMANWILGHTDRFKCIVSHDGTFNTTAAWGTTEELWFPEWELKGTPYTNRAMYDKWSPHLSATNFKTPTLVVHSQLDYRLDVSEGFQLFTTLQRLGVPSKMLYFPDEGHWVLKPQNSQLWWKTVNDWVDEWVKK